MFVGQEERLDYVVDNYIELFQRMLSEQGVDVFDPVFRENQTMYYSRLQNGTD